MRNDFPKPDPPHWHQPGFSQLWNRLPLRFLQSSFWKLYFICLNCSCNMITITITITITIIIPITLTTISTPETFMYLLLPSFVSSPSLKPSQFTNSLHKAFLQPSFLLLTIVNSKIVQIKRDWFTGRLNRFALSGTSRQCKGTGVCALLALELIFYSTYSADPFRTFPDPLQLTHL